MIELIFDFLSEKVIVIVEGTAIKFGKTDYGAQVAEIDNLKLSYQGVVKQFPDLEGNPNWNRIAIQRFKDKIKSFQTEDERAGYIIEDLRGHGYIPRYKKRKGFRIERIK